MSLYFLYGAQGEIRTHTPQVITAFEAAASTVPPLVHIRILGIISSINKPRQRHPLFFQILYSSGEKIKRHTFLLFVRNNACSLLEFIVIFKPQSKKTATFKSQLNGWCGKWDSNPHALAPDSKSGSSTNSDIPAYEEN